MRALLILRRNGTSLRVLVRVRDRSTRNRVRSLLAGSRSREAFQLLVCRAEVEEYLPEGVRLARHPEVTLVQDLLS